MFWVPTKVPTVAVQALDEWAYQHSVKLRLTEPGKPVQNAFIESFNGKFRDECLNEHWFISLQDAREKSEAWRRDYNEVRPRSALGNRTPEEFTGAGAPLPPEPPRREEQKQNQPLEPTLRLVQKTGKVMAYRKKALRWSRQLQSDRSS